MFGTFEVMAVARKYFWDIGDDYGYEEIFLKHWR